MAFSLSRTQEYLDWMKTKIFLDHISINKKARVVRRGEVYICNLGKGIGSEEEKERPCLVIQNDIGNINSANTIVVPITNAAGTPAVTIPISGTYNYLEDGTNKTLTGYILLGNIVTVSKARLGDCIASLKVEMNDVDEKIMVSTGVMRLYNDAIKKLSREKTFIRKMLTEINALRQKVIDLELVIEKHKVDK